MTTTVTPTKILILFAVIIRHVTIRFTSLILIILAACLIILDLNIPKVTLPIKHNIISNISYTIEYPTKLLNSFLQTINEIAKLPSLKLEAVKLKQENELLKMHYHLNDQIKAENLQFKKLLNYVANDNFHFLSSRLIINSSNINFKNSIIDVGSAQGVRKGLAVVSNQGLIGKIVEVSDNKSIVLLISDYSFRIPVVTVDSSK
jgi:rod shape-determining protein MreC